MRSQWTAPEEPHVPDTKPVGQIDVHALLGCAFDGVELVVRVGGDVSACHKRVVVDGDGRTTLHLLLDSGEDCLQVALREAKWVTR